MDWFMLGSVVGECFQILSRAFPALAFYGWEDHTLMGSTICEHPPAFFKTHKDHSWAHIHIQVIQLKFVYEVIYKHTKWNLIKLLYSQLHLLNKTPFYILGMVCLCGHTVSRHWARISHIGFWFESEWRNKNSSCCIFECCRNTFLGLNVKL